MVKRICATLAIAIIFFFLGVQGTPQAVAIEAPLAQAGVHTTGRTISQEDVTIYKTPAEYPDSTGDTSVPLAPIVTRYSESDQAWTFFAKVVQLKNVSIFGRPGTIAQIEYMRDGLPQYAWTVIKIDDYYFSDDTGAIIAGQEIRLESSGEHVSANGVNWDACPRDDKYCQYASFIEGDFQ